MSDFHTLNPRILYGFAVDGSWCVYLMSELALGEFVEVLSNRNAQVMAQGRVTHVRRSRDDGRFRVTIQLEPVTPLMLLEAACSATSSSSSS